MLIDSRTPQKTDFQYKWHFTYDDPQLSCLAACAMKHFKRRALLMAVDCVLFSSETCFLQLGTSLHEAGENRGESSPLLLIQGEFKKTVATVKVAVDSTVMEAGSSILEGLDRLFKIFWIFNLDYNDKCKSFLFFLQTIFGMKYGSLPATVKQLRSILNLP